MTFFSIAAAAGAVPPRSGSYGIDVDGDGAGVTVTGRTGIAHAVPLDRAAHSGDPAHRDIRIAYELQAEAAGLDPATIRRGSAEDRQVLADLGATLTRIGAQPRGHGGVAGAITALRAEAQATVAQRHAAASTGIDAVTIAAAARAPGAAMAADLLPEARMLAGALRSTPATAAAGAAGLAAGSAIAIGAGSWNADAPTATTTEDRATVRATLATDRDGKLQCREIGTWTLETGARSYSANVRAYQAYVSGVDGMDFTVATPVTRAVRFDGCVDRVEGAVLLEAKADHGDVLKLGSERWSYAFGTTMLQGRGQQDVAIALSTKVEWHVQTEMNRDAIVSIFRKFNIFLPVIHDPCPRPAGDYN